MVSKVFEQTQGALAQLFSLQLGISALVAMVFVLLEHPTAGVAACLGGLVCVVPSALAVRYFLSERRGNSAPERFRHLCWAEVIKLITTALFFWCIAQYWSAALLPLLLGFVAAEVTFVVAPLFLKGDIRAI